MIDEIKASKKATGVEKIYFPGEIEATRLDACLDAGYIDIADATMEAIERAEKSFS